MTLAQLRYAITVANSNSMNEAARNLFISQPSLSSAIRELEEEIGVELFRRTNRGISVTPVLFWCFLKCSRRTLRGFQDIRRGAQPRSSPLLSMTFLYHQKLSLR